MRRRGGWLDNNTFALVISILMAFAVWLAVSTNGSGSPAAGIATESAVISGVPVSVLAHGGMMAVSVRPGKVDIEVQGSVLDVTLTKAQAGNIRVVANALNLSPGSHRVAVHVENLPTPAVVATPQPASTVVDIQQKASMYVAVKPVLNGVPAGGQRVGRPLVSVRRVLVTGPEVLVRQVARVEATLDIGGAQNSLTRNVALVAVSKSGLPLTTLKCEPSTATVSVPILEQDKQVPLYATTTGRPAPGMVVAAIGIEPTSVLVSGPSGLLHKTTVIVLPPIDVSNWEIGHTLVLSVPAPFDGAKLNTPAARVTVQIVPGVTVTEGQVPVQIIGQRSGYAYQWAGPQTVSVQVIGAPGQIANFQAQDIQAYVDVQGLAKLGRTALPVTVSLPQGISLVSVTPATLPVMAGRGPSRAGGGTGAGG